MTDVMDRVCKEALELPLDQRLTLVYHILEQSEPCSNPEEVEREWDGVVRERIERYDAGQAQTRSALDVFSALDKRLGE